MNFLRFRTAALLAVTLAAVAAAPALAAGFDDFKLARAVPDDVAIVAAARHHAGMKFVDEQMKRVWAEVEKAHFDRDLKKLIQDMAKENGQQLDDFDTQWQQFSDLLSTIDWSTLCQNEFVFAMKVNDVLFADFVMLISPPAEKLQSDFDGMAQLLRTLEKLSNGELKLATTGEGESVVHKLAIEGAPVPFGLTLAREKNAIVVGFGTTLADTTIGMLKGQGGKGVLGSDRFQGAFKKLPAPVDGFAFIDMTRLIGQMRRLADHWMKQIPDQDPKATALPSKIFDALDMWDYVAETATTDGMKRSSTAVTVLRDDAASKPFYKAIYGNAPLTEPLKYVPANAKNFSANSGIDMLSLYTATVKFIKESVPEGDTAIEQWDKARADMPFDIEKDLLAWIGGSITTFSMRGSSKFAPPEWAAIISVKDEKKASDFLESMIQMANPMIQQQNGSISDAKIEEAPSFKMLVHPMLGLMPGLSQPTFGVKDNMLFIGSSPKPVTAALKAASSKENFSSNDRFQKEGLKVGKDVVSISFSDLSNMGEETGQMLQMIPGMLSLAGGGALAHNPGAQAALRIMTKVGNVVKKLDFFLSECSETTVEGKVYTTTSIVNYQEPPKSTAAPEDKPSDEPKSDKPADKGAKTP